MRCSLVAVCLVLAASVGCGTPGYLRADAIEGTLTRVLDRHDEYTQDDTTLSPLHRRASLRDTEVLRKALEEAEDTSGK